MAHEAASSSGSRPNPRRRQLATVKLYTVGIITALATERGAVACMMDEEHELPPDLKRLNDPNFYSLGRIGQHNVVLTSFAAEITGLTMATATAMPMLNTFPSIRFGLMVGIGAGIPQMPKHDIRLGDVVVSLPKDRSGGVFQYDFGRVMTEEKWEPKDWLARPPEVLLRAINGLQAEHIRSEPLAHGYLQEAARRYPKWAERVKYPQTAVDKLFNASYVHQGGFDDCGTCDSKEQVPREDRKSQDLQIHYGVIGSGNAVVKDAQRRDKFASREYGCICLETEAAGLMNNFPCLVVRGISDYADSHKNDVWQPYAASTAAAVAKEILHYVQPQTVRESAAAAVIMGHKVDGVQNNQLERRRNRFLQALFPKSRTFAEQKKSIPTRDPDTCIWLTGHEYYQSWLEGEATKLLWISANTGCGKSVLCKFLIDEGLRSSNHTICYFFFKQGNLEDPLCALLHQLFVHERSLLDEQTLKIHDNRGHSFVQSFNCLWEILLSSAEKKNNSEKEEEEEEEERAAEGRRGHIICVLDALDECPRETQEDLMHALASFCNESRKTTSRLKFLVTSQPETNISAFFEKIEAIEPPSALRVQAESQNILDQINGEVNRVIKRRLRRIIPNDRGFRAEMFKKLTSDPNRTYLFADLALKEFEKNIRAAPEQKQNALSSTPRNVHDAYERTLNRDILNRDFEQEQRRKRLLSIVVTAYRALTVDELIVAIKLGSTEDTNNNEIDLSASEEVKHDLVRKTSGNFVNIINDKVYLIHQTARGFLLSNRGPWKSPLDRSDLSFPPETSSRGALHIESHSKWEHSFDNQTMHQLFAKLCADFLDSKFEHDRLPEFKKYCHMYLFAHLFEAGPYVSDPLADQAIEVLKKHKSEWNLIYKHMPNYDHESISFCPEWDGPILNLVSYLGIFKLISQALKEPISIKEAKSSYPWLCIAVARDDQKMVRSFLSQRGADPDVKSRDNITPLHAAVICGRLDMVSILLKAGAAIEAMTKEGRTPLHLAIWERRFEVAERLIKKGARVEAKIPETGYCPLHLATVQQLPKFVQLLLNNKAKVNAKAKISRFPRIEEYQTALHLAAQHGNLEILKMLLSKNADINALDHRKFSALHIAIKQNHYEAVQILLDHKDIDVNIKDQNASSPLFHAISMGKFGLVKLLLDHHKSRLGSVELTRAMQPSEVSSTVTSQQVLDLLLDHANKIPLELQEVLYETNTILDSSIATRIVEAGAQVTTKVILAALERWTIQQSNPQLAKIDPEAKTIEILLQKINPNSLDEKECASMLSKAMQCKCWNTVQRLIERKIVRFRDVEPAYRKEWFLWAAQTGHVQSIDFLLSNGIIVHTTDNTGRTAFSYAISYGLKQKPQQESPNEEENEQAQPIVDYEKAKQFNDIATTLLKAGASPDPLDRDGHPARDWAKWAGNTEAAALLSEYHRDPLADRLEPVVSAVGPLPVIVVPPYSRVNALVAGISPSSSSSSLLSPSRRSSIRSLSFKNPLGKKQQ